MKDSCCLDCKDRKPLCHSTCEKYLNFRKKIDYIKERKRIINEFNYYNKRRRKSR